MKHNPHGHHLQHHTKPLENLGSITPGARIRVAGFASGMASDQRERLLAYGLIPGQILRVLSQKPLTVVQIEHTELALEGVLAACIEVAAPATIGEAA